MRAWSAYRLDALYANLAPVEQRFRELCERFDLSPAEEDEIPVLERKIARVQSEIDELEDAIGWHAYSADVAWSAGR